VPSDNSVSSDGHQPFPGEGSKWRSNDILKCILTGIY